MSKEEVIGGDEFRVRSGYAAEGVRLFIQAWTDTEAKGTIVPLRQWRSPASAYPRRAIGRARIKTAWYQPGVYDAYMQKGVSFYNAIRRLYVTTLQIDENTWMVDDPPHWWAMEEHATYYKGHVVCAGLGLGLMVHAMTPRPEIEKITVVERERDVIDLVAPLVPHEKLQIVHGDFWDQSPDTIRGVDGVFWDLFVGEGPLLVQAAVHVMHKLYETWFRSEEFVARIHGVPNGLILDQMARSANVGTGGD